MCLGEALPPPARENDEAQPFKDQESTWDKGPLTASLTTKGLKGFKGQLGEQCLAHARTHTHTQAQA